MFEISHTFRYDHELIDHRVEADPRVKAWQHEYTRLDHDEDDELPGNVILGSSQHRT